MAIVAETFQGVAAFGTCNDTTSGDLGYCTSFSVDLVVVDGYATPVLTSSISIPLPTGCVSFSDVFVAFKDDGALYVGVNASSAATFAAADAAPNQMKAQLHKYIVTDDGQYTLAWHGTETGFMASARPGLGFPGGDLAVTRDGSWGTWGRVPFDAGTGVFDWPAPVSYFDSLTGQTYLAFTSTYAWYESSGIANCLRRTPITYSTLDNLYHEAVAFDGTVVRSAHWPAPKISDYVAGSAAGYEFQDMQPMKSYRDPFLEAYATWYNSDRDLFYFQTASVDLDTYLPFNWSPLFESGQQTLSPYLNILPLLGVSGSPSSHELLILKRGADGYFVPYNSTAVVRPATSAALFNGLTAIFTVDSGNDPHFLPQASLGWIDSTGASTAIGAVSLSREPRAGSWIFRPTLPVERLTGHIDSTRRLFTAV